MNPYIYPVVCSVCGGPGVGHASYIGADWLGANFVHRDPVVCRDYLAKKKRWEEAAREPKMETVAEGGGI